MNESQYRQSILPRGYQAIVPSYRFNCNGNITEWTIAVTQIDKYDLELQVWRPSPTGDDTRGYVLIGQNSFNRHIPNRPPKNSSKLLGVIQATPRPEDQLQVEPGDILGVYVFSYLPRGSGIALLSGDRGNRSQLLEEEVWYAKVDKQTVVGGGGDCLETTILDTFINAIPVISVTVDITTDNGKNVYNISLGVIKA